MQRFYQERPRSELALYPSIQERGESKLISKNQDLEHQFEGKEITNEIGELQNKVDLIMPNLARLLNELNTYEINDSQWVINYEPDEKIISYQGFNEPDEKIQAIWDNDHWLAQSGNLSEDRALEIANLLAINLEIASQIKKQRERQQDLEFDF